MMPSRQQALPRVEEGRATRPTTGSGEKTDPPAVVLGGLHKSFGSQIVLDGIELTVESGETLAMLGRSGTGKSVLLKLIIGLEKPDSGFIRVHGQEITRLDLDALNAIRKKMGFLFQNAALYDSLSVEQNIAFPLKRHTKMTDSELGDRVKELLSSVGMQKRVGLARALALEPGILLLDEPTAGLDPITSGEIDELILKLQEEHHMASIVVTHDLRSAKTIADRIALLHEGNVLIEGSFEDLEKSDNKFVSEFMKRDS